MLDQARVRSDIEWVLADAASAAWDREFDRPQVEHGVLRFLDPEALARFLRDAGFVIERQFGDWQRGPLTDAGQEIITIARRA